MGVWTLGLFLGNPAKRLKKPNVQTPRLPNSQTPKSLGRWARKECVEREVRQSVRQDFRVKEEKIGVILS